MKMSFVGFPIDINEALRLLKLEESFVKSFYDTNPIQNYLKNKKSGLIFCYIDKGTCLLGYPIAKKGDPVGMCYKVEDTIIEIIRAKQTFIKEIKKLEIDISAVNITQIEEESYIDTSGEPFIISL